MSYLSEGRKDGLTSEGRSCNERGAGDRLVEERLAVGLC